MIPRKVLATFGMLIAAGGFCTGKAFHEDAPWRKLRAQLADVVLNGSANFLTVPPAVVAYSADTVDMKWSEPAKKAVNILGAATELHEFSVEHVAACTDIEENGGSLFSEQRLLRIELEFKREIGYYITQTYLPTILLIFVNWLSFWMEVGQTAARTGICITTVLTLQTIQLGSNRIMPAVSYFKAMDIWLMVCQTFVTSGLAVFIINHNICGPRNSREKQKQMETARKIDHWCRIIYPVLFIIFGVTYWCVYLVNY